MKRHLDRRDFLLGTAALSLVGGVLAGCGRRSPADLPALRVSTIGKGEADMRLLQNTAQIQAETFRIPASLRASMTLTTRPKGVSRSACIWNGAV